VGILFVCVSVLIVVFLPCYKHRQNWKFLDEVAGYEGEVFHHRAEMEAEIAELEKKTIEEKLLDYYRAQVAQKEADELESVTTMDTSTVTGTSTTLTSTVAGGGNNIGEHAHKHSKRLPSELTPEEALELKTSLNMLKMFYEQRSHYQQLNKKVELGELHTTKPGKVMDSPRAALTASTLTEHNNNQLKDTLLASAPTYERKELTLMSMQAALERKLLKQMLNAELLASQKINKQKNSVSNAERTKQRVAAVAEHLKAIEISKCFKKYIEEKGNRMPYFLRKVDANAPPLHMKESEVKALLNQNQRRASLSNGNNKGTTIEVAARAALSAPDSVGYGNISRSPGAYSINSSPTSSPRVVVAAKPPPRDGASPMKSVTASTAGPPLMAKIPEGPAPSRKSGQSHRAVS
jgi:hypothetical protein